MSEFNDVGLSRSCFAGVLGAREDGVRCLIAPMGNPGA